MAKHDKSVFKIAIGKPMPLGVTEMRSGVNFAIALPNEEVCRLNLYDRNTGVLIESILLKKTYQTGSVFSVIIKDLDLQNYSYRYQTKDRDLIDPYAKVIYGRENYGKLLTEEEKTLIRGGFITSDFNWQEDQVLQLPYSELIIYKLHVRGFTKHPSSLIKHRGTFLGIREKISYLKELGINCILFMPIYEYNEVLEYKGITDESKINYWGYSEDNQYFSIKSSYAANPSQADYELKTLVRDLHKNGIEVIMEMNFTNGTNQGFIQDCLRYWSNEYHVDGFRLIGDSVPSTLLATDPLLSNTKLLAPDWSMNQIYDKDLDPNYKNLAEYKDGYSVDVKRFLRGDEDQVGAFASRMKQHPAQCGVINYITNHDGFTMMDLYSYDEKQNEANGENNRDGEEYNYSWNCGEEGSTKKKKVQDLRRKQIRNAFTALLFSQGTPLLLSGDEFGNSQQGNNNAYCQDNDISWLDWRLSKTNSDIYGYVKQLITIRKEHPILHMSHPLRNMDYIYCGFPDLSFHGTKAWYPNYSHYSRMLGVLLSGNYVKINHKEKDQTFYIGFNMHWEKHEFDLPRLPLGMKWHLLLDTANREDETTLQPTNNQKKYEVLARSVVVLISKLKSTSSQQI